MAEVTLREAEVTAKPQPAKISVEELEDRNKVRDVRSAFQNREITR